MGLAETASIRIRMDADLKRQFEEFCDDMGMSVATAINIFAKKVVREYRIPFEIAGDIPNEETRRAIEDSYSDGELSREFHSVKELMEDLNADD